MGFTHDGSLAIKDTAWAGIRVAARHDHSAEPAPP